MKKTILYLLLIITACAAIGCSATRPDQSKETAVTEIQFIRNATMKMQYAGMTILMDPMLGAKGSLPGYLSPEKINPTSDLPLPKEEILAGVDALLLSHTHIAEGYSFDDLVSDHMDPVALKSLDKNLPVYLQPFDMAGMKHMGFNHLHPVEKNVNIGPISVQRFAGKHTSIDALLPMIGESSGYVISAPGAPTILWTGDTLLIDEVKGAIQKYQPDVIIVHSGGAWLPIDDKGNKATLLMGAEETIEIARLAPAAKIIAIHMEALDHCPVTRDELRALATAGGIDEKRLIIPNNGETIKL